MSFVLFRLWVVPLSLSPLNKRQKKAAGKNVHARSWGQEPHEKSKPKSLPFHDWVSFSMQVSNLINCIQQNCLSWQLVIIACHQQPWEMSRLIRLNMSSSGLLEISALSTLLIVFFQMNGRKAKLGQFPNSFLHYVVQRRNHQNTGIGRLLHQTKQTKHLLLYQALSKACWQNCNDVLACEKWFQNFYLLRFQGIYLRKSSPVAIFSCGFLSRLTQPTKWKREY